MVHNAGDGSAPAYFIPQEIREDFSTVCLGCLKSEIILLNFFSYVKPRKKNAVYISRTGKEGHMQDEEIVELYWQRNQRALLETSQKYRAYCMKISMNILENIQDSEECLNDTLLKAWDAIPPHRPECLSAFLGKITRNLAINRYNVLHAGKRGAGEYALSLEELDECVPGNMNVEDKLEASALSHSISSFLREQSRETRRVFIRRYFYSDSIAEISEKSGLSQGKIKTMLFRTRNRLRKYLEKEGMMG